MRGFRGGLISGLIVLGSVVVAAPAQASGGLSVPDGVLYECAEHTFTIGLVASPGYSGDIYGTVRATGPDGLEADSTSFDFQSGQTSGQASFFFCPSDMPGTYTATGTARACDADYNCVSVPLGPDTFTLRQPHTRTKLKVSSRHPKLNSVVTFTITSTDERPRGYFPSDYFYVWLEKREGSRWVRVRQSKTFADDGREVLQYRFDLPRAAVRAVRPTDSYGEGSQSRPITIVSHR